MVHRRDFEIAFVGLKLGVHQLEYQIDQSFFEKIDRTAPEGNNIQVVVNLTLDKKPNFFMLKFDVNGTIDVNCDRCGDEFTLQLWDEFNLIVKLTENENEISDGDEDTDVVFLPRSESIMDVGEWIYEFIMLSIPIQKIHPDKADGTSGCNEETLKLLNRFSPNTENEQHLSETWKGLNKIDKNKFDNN